MHKATKLLAIGMMSLAPFAALAADAPAAATELHGFDKYWSMMDPAGKGFVTKEEFMKHQEERFKEIDTNGDGKISKEEMKAYDDKMYQKRQQKRAQYKKNKSDSQ